MYITSGRAQFTIYTHRCWNWHLCIPDGLSVVQCSSGMSLELCFFTQFQCHQANVLDNWQLEELPQFGGHEFDPRRVQVNLSVLLWVYMRFPACARASQLNQQICISPTPGCSSKLTPTGVEIDTCSFQTGCHVSSAASGMSLDLCFLHNLCGLKRTCWATGSWQSCLSLEVMMSGPW